MTAIQQRNPGTDPIAQKLPRPVQQALRRQDQNQIVHSSGIRGTADLQALKTEAVGYVASKAQVTAAMLGQNAETLAAMGGPLTAELVVNVTRGAGMALLNVLADTSWRLSQW